jgi:hypothetical protein
MDKTDGRLILFAPYVCRVLGQMRNMRISLWLKKNKKFSDTQYGYLRYKICTDNLAITSTEKIKGIE